jgi:outer membrane protein assembly factor BamE
MHSWTRSIIVSVLLLSCLGLAGCPFPPRIYRIDIQQGNSVTEEMKQRLRKGMTKAQVQEIMGTPTLMHVFNADRWDYYYYFKTGNTGEICEKDFTVFFKGDRVSGWSE